MVNTEIIRVGYKIYIITKTDNETIITTVGEHSKIEKRKFKSWLAVSFQERLKIIIARILKEKESKK